MAGPSRDNHDRVPDEFELKGDAVGPDPFWDLSDDDSASTPGPTGDPEKPVEDGMHPPTVPILVHCLHCGEEFDSWRIEWRVRPSRDGRPHGLWCCPIPGCDGVGFGVDIWPVDMPEDGPWTDPDGRELYVSWDDDDEEWEDDAEDWDSDDEFDDLRDNDRDGPASEGDIPF